MELGQWNRCDQLDDSTYPWMCHEGQSGDSVHQVGRKSTMKSSHSQHLLLENITKNFRQLHKRNVDIGFFYGFRSYRQCCESGKI